MKPREGMKGVDLDEAVVVRPWETEARLYAEVGMGGGTGSRR